MLFQWNIPSSIRINLSKWEFWRVSLYRPDGLQRTPVGLQPPKKNFSWSCHSPQDQLPTLHHVLSTHLYNWHAGLLESLRATLMYLSRLIVRAHLDPCAWVSSSEKCFPPENLSFQVFLDYADVILILKDVYLLVSLFPQEWRTLLKIAFHSNRENMKSDGISVCLVFYLICPANIIGLWW